MCDGMGVMHKWYEEINQQGICMMCVCVRYSVSIDVKTLARLYISEYAKAQPQLLVLVPFRGITLTEQKFRLIMFEEVFGAGLMCDISHRAL